MTVITLSVHDVQVWVDEHLWESPRTLLISKGTYEVTFRPCDAKWNIDQPSLQKNTAYVRCRLAQRDGCRSVLLHRLITQAAPRVLVDHINGNGLDNRIENLRHTDSLGNSHNKRASRNSTSRFVGVARHGSRFKAFARVGVRNLYLGSFIHEEDAAIARDAWTRENRPEFGYLNFPDIASALTTKGVTQ